MAEPQVEIQVPTAAQAVLAVNDRPAQITNTIQSADEVHDPPIQLQPPDTMVAPLSPTNGNGSKMTKIGHMAKFCSIIYLALNIGDCVGDLMLYSIRNEQIEDICQTAEMKVQNSTKSALEAMLVFLVIGTIMAIVSVLNHLVLYVCFCCGCKVKMIHPLILSILACLFEELPLAGLRWNLKTSANNENETAGIWSIVTGVLSFTAPLAGPLWKCINWSDCVSSNQGKEETCCDNKCSKKCEFAGLCFLVTMTIGLIIINGLNWADFVAPGAELCV